MIDLHARVHEFMRPSLESQWKELEPLIDSNEWFMENMYASVKGFVTDGMDYLVNAFKGSDASHVVQFDRNRWLERQIDGLELESLTALSLRKMPGLNTPMGKWINALSDTQDVVDQIEKNVLKPSLKALSFIISNPETLSARTPALALSKVQAPDLKKAKKTLGNCLKENDDSNSATFFELYRDRKDFSVVEKEFEKILKSFEKIRRKDVIDGTDQIVEIANKIFFKVEDEDDPTELSSSMSKSLSTLTWDIAQCVELYAVHSYNIMATSEAMMANHAELTQLAK